MKVAVIGCGYVGLVSAVGLATVGHDVVGIDSDRDRLAKLAGGETPFHEPGLAPALEGALVAGRLCFDESLAAAAGCEVVLLCVQTPPLASGSVDLQFVELAAHALSQVLGAEDAPPCVVAIRSTVPPGTNEKVVAPLLARPGRVAVASNPEFLREGSALDDFTGADRVVVGVVEDWAAAQMAALYHPLRAPLILTGPATAELAKYVSNAFLATLVSFSNEVGRLCEATQGVDVEDVLGILHRDRRLDGPTGPATITSYLKAGCGFGGSCLPKDLSALIAYGRASGESVTLLEAVAEVNHGQVARLAELTDRAVDGLAGKRVAVLGAAFKAGTDDLRESPALRLVPELVARGAAVVVYDPLVAPQRLRAVLADGVEVASSLDAALDGARACLVTTLAPEFADLATRSQHRNGSGPLIVDGRRGLDPAGFDEARYRGVGRAAP